MKQLREYRRKSQADFAELLGISQQSYSKKERERAEGGNDGFSPDDFVRILEATEIDARWLFGQLQGPIEGADLRISGGKTDAAEMHEVVSEYRAWKDSLSKKDSLSQRLQSDPELLECVELMIRHRGEVSRVRGYIDRMTEDRSRLG